MREVLIAAVFAWPAGRVKNRVLRLLGMSVHPDARIGPNLVFRVAGVEIGRATIGFGNVFRGLDELRLADGAIIANWNSVTVARPFSGHTEQSCRLVLGVEAAITSRHCLDCSGGIFIGDFSTVSGMGSTLLTHGIDDVDNVQDCAAIVIDHHARLGSNNRVAMGAHLPERSVTSMGAVVTPGLTEPGQLYAGVPARAKKPVSGKWFTRTDGLTPVRSTARVSPLHSPDVRRPTSGSVAS